METGKTEIDMYTTTYCPYCMMAKSLLTAKGVAWNEIDLMEQPSRREEMISRADGRQTVPQIFINGEGLGGYDEIVALDRQGKLDSLLGLSN